MSDHRHLAKTEDSKTDRNLQNITLQNALIGTNSFFYLTQCFWKTTMLFIIKSYFRKLFFLPQLTEDNKYLCMKIDLISTRKKRKISSWLQKSSTSPRIASASLIFQERRDRTIVIRLRHQDKSNKWTQNFTSTVTNCKTMMITPATIIEFRLLSHRITSHPNQWFPPTKHRGSQAAKSLKPHQKTSVSNLEISRR